MTTEQALNDYFARTGLLPEGCTREDWYAGHWVPFKIGGVKVGAFPVLQREGPILIHDLHHMLTGCAPDWRGEVELAGWEIASGGCGWHGLYWLDRISLVLLGALTNPRILWRGLRAGWGRRNLYRRRPPSLLPLEVETLRRNVVG